MSDQAPRIEYPVGTVLYLVECGHCQKIAEASEGCCPFCGYDGVSPASDGMYLVRIPKPEIVVVTDNPNKVETGVPTSPPPAGDEPGANPWQACRKTPGCLYYDGHSGECKPSKFGRKDA